MTFAVFGLIGFFICWKMGDLKNWREYYSTILYFFIGDIVCDYLTSDKLLFQFSALAEKSPVVDVCIMVLLYSSTTILYLAHYPSGIKKQILYLLFWIALFTSIELASSLLDDFVHKNGWNMYYSILFNALMFPLLRLHYKKPLLVWPISVALCFALLWWFRIPLCR